MTTDTTFIGDCDSCQFEGIEVKTYDPPFGKTEKHNLCELCSSTMTSTALDYPRQYEGKVDQIMQTICYVGNAILAEIRKGAVHVQGNEP